MVCLVEFVGFLWFSCVMLCRYRILMILLMFLLIIGMCEILVERNCFIVVFIFVLLLIVIMLVCGIMILCMMVLLNLKIEWMSLWLLFLSMLSFVVLFIMFSNCFLFENEIVVGCFGVMWLLRVISRLVSGFKSMWMNWSIGVVNMMMFFVCVWLID